MPRIPMPKLTVAAAQVFTNGTLAGNAAVLRGLLREAIRRNVDLVAFPEAALSGYSCKMGFPRTLDARAIERELRRMAALCRKGRLAAAVPTAFRGPDGWHNGIVLLDRDGREAGRYVKTFDAGEKWAVPRNTLCVFTLCGVKVC